MGDNDQISPNIENQDSFALLNKKEEGPTEEEKKEERKQSFLKKLKLKIRKNIIAEEEAEFTFDAILYKYDIDPNDIVIENGKEAAQTMRNKFVRAIRTGRLSVNVSEDKDKGFQIIQTLHNGKAVAYNEYGGVAGEESGKGKTTQDKQYKLMASLSGQSTEHLKNPNIYNGEDLRLCEEIAMIFFW